MGSRIGKIWLALGYLFLYLPIFTLIVFSFNDSKMVALWGGFTLKWYDLVASDTEVIDGPNTKPMAGLPPAFLRRYVSRIAPRLA